MTTEPNFTAPKNWVNAQDACILFFQGEDQCRNSAQERDALNAAVGENARIHIFHESETPPWKREDLVSLLSERSHRQCLIVSPSANSFYAACAVFSLEIGYDTYVVLRGAEAIEPVELLRLEHIGARVLRFAQLLTDLELALSD